MTPESDAALEPATCRELGYLMVSGKRVATLRCGGLAGHGARHVAAFEWEDAAPEVADDWPERYDVDETFEVDVPMLDAETLAEIAETSRDNLKAAIERVKLVEPVDLDDEALDVLAAILRSRDVDRIVQSLRGSGA
jgi:hypothetical protein